MRILSKASIAALALAVCSSLAVAQNAPPPSGQPSTSPGVHRPLHSRQNDRRWDRRGDRDWGRMQRHGRMGRDFMLARMVRNPSFRERIGITADQAQKIQTETFDFRKNQIRDWADIQVKRLELRNLLSADNPDRSAIDQKLQELSTAQLTQQKASIGFRLDMRSALTLDQKQKLRQMREEFFQRRFDGRAPGGPGADMPPPPPANGN